MPAKSLKQKHFFQLVRAYQTGKKIDVSPAVKKVAGSISAKDASDFASSLAELKTKKAMVSILKDIIEPMYLQELDHGNQDTIEPVATTFTIKKDWDSYIKAYLGQPLSQKELEALGNFKEKKPTTISRTEIWYKSTDNMGISHTTVIKKMKDSGQFSYTSFQKQERPIGDQEKENEKKKKEMDSMNSVGNLSPENPTTPQQLSPPSSSSTTDDEDKEDVIVTKSILFKDDIKGAAILVEFLKKLDL